MSLRIAPVGVLLAVTLLACSGPVARPTPTPDIPAFAPGEASALVKKRVTDRWLLASLVESSRYVELVECGPGSLINLLRLDETYEGASIWRVKYEAPDLTLTWRAYEETETVELIERPTDTGVQRPAC